MINSYLSRKQFNKTAIGQSAEMLVAFVLTEYDRQGQMKKPMYLSVMQKYVGFSFFQKSPVENFAKTE